MSFTATKNSAIISVVRIKNIYVLVNVARCSARGILQGVLKYAALRSEWRLHICNLPDDGYEQLCSALEAEKVDGVISSELENERLCSLLERSIVPLVVIGTRETCLPNRRVNLSVVTSDEIRLGEIAARHLIYLGRFKSYGFVPIRERTYRFLCGLRQKGFESEIKKVRLPPVAYRPEGVKGVPDDLALEKWLLSLEKPAAVCVGCDRRAVDVINACSRCGIRIPDDLRVLGIDNDEFLCLSTKPTLSSIMRDSSAEGYAASLKLAQLLRQRRPQQKRTLHLCKYQYQIVTRGSTAVVSPGVDLIRRAREFIHLNISDPLTINDIATHLHVSQRLLFLRFKQFSKTSLQETIGDERLRVIKQLLSRGNLNHADIAKRTGCRDAISMRRLFKRLEGCSIRAWQKSRLRKE